MENLSIKEVAEYVIKNHPESCIAYNVKDYTNEYEGILIDELDSFFTYDIIGICGCGDPDLCKKDIRDILNIIYEYDNSEDDFSKKYEVKQNRLLDRFGCMSVYDNSLLLFMVYILDNVGLLEHGSGIGGAWITNLGNMCRVVYNNLKLDEED